MDKADTKDEKNKYSKDFMKLQKTWQKEIQAAQKKASKFHKTGSEIVDRYLGNSNNKNDPMNKSRVNLFHSNTKTLMSLLYGQIPTIDVSRSYADAKDDVSRVAAEMLERILNCDVQENGAETNVVLRSVLQDRLLAGLGAAKVRYEYNSRVGDDGLEYTASEYTPLEYYYWKDILYGWGRSFIKLPWIAYRSYLTKKEMTERFGEEVASDVNVEYKNQDVVDEGEAQTNSIEQDPTKKAEVWEIWDKGSKRVIWMNPKAQKVFDVKDDPLGLKGFFPSPPFFLANPTTTDYVATADFKLSEDLYNNIDILQTRIDRIMEAVKVVGVYDQSAEGVQELMSTNIDNKLIPIERWAMFGEKGGLGNQIEWLPVQEVAETLLKLIQLRDDNIGLLQQVSGMADIMRGNLGNQYEGVGQTDNKVKFGSSRVQALQDEFAQFATDLMQLKADLMLKHYDPQTLVRMSNMQNSFDAQYIPQAIQLLQSPDAAFRVKIRPESVAMVDFAQLQQERVGFINGMATFLQAATPMMEKEPSTAPFLLQMLQWGMAGFKGSSEIEGVMDRAIQAATEATQQKQGQPQPNPEAEREQIKARGEMMKIQAKAQGDIQVRNNDLQADLQTIAAQSKADLLKIQAENGAELSEIQAKAEASIQEEIITSQANTEQNLAGVAGEMQKQLEMFEMDMVKMREQTNLNMIEEQQRAENQINESIGDTDDI